MALLLSLGAMLAQAEETYPNKPIRVLVPFSAGGALDAVARPLAEAYQRAHRQSMVIENLGGAGGTIAAVQIVRAKPDGYQLLMGSSGQVSIAPYAYPSLPYDPLQDLVPIVHLANSTAVLYANADSGFDSVQAVIDKARSGQTVDFAHTGIGSISHLALELLAHETGTSFNQIPYKGAGLALPNLAGGQVPLLFTFVSSAMPMASAGRIRPLAVAAPQRIDSLPDVPTFAELGYPGIVAQLWIGLMAPKGTPAPIVAQLSREVGAILETPQMKAQLAPQGLEIAGGTPADFGRMIENDSARWQALSKAVDFSSE